MTVIYIAVLGDDLKNLHIRRAAFTDTHKAFKWIRRMQAKDPILYAEAELWTVDLDKEEENQ